MYKNILIALLLCLNFAQVKATTNDEYFLIYGDSQNPKEAYTIKKQLISEYEELVKGLDKSDISKAIEISLVSEHVTYDNHTLVIVVGDGKGDILKGKLKADYCVIEKDEIETEFFFKKLWQSATS